MWQNEVRGQKPACVPDDNAVCCCMQHLRKHQSAGQQIRNDPPEKGLTRNTTCSWWIALDTMKEIENCLKKLDRGVSRNSRNWAEQEKAEVNNSELRSQLGRIWKKLLLEYSEIRRGHPQLPNLWWRKFSPRRSVSYFSRGALLKSHWKIWTHVTKWSTGTKACLCTRWSSSMMLHAALESTPERRATTHSWSPLEGTHIEHYSFLVDSPEYDERAREMSEEAGSWSFQKASKLVQAAKCRGE